MGLKRNLLLCQLLWQLSVVVVFAAPALGDWPQFRGPNSSGIAPGVSPPVEFGPGRNELWKVPMVAGHSPPIVVGDVIFLTTWDKEDRKLAVLLLLMEKAFLQREG